MENWGYEISREREGGRKREEGREGEGERREKEVTVTYRCLHYTYFITYYGVPLFVFSLIHSLGRAIVYLTSPEPSNLAITLLFFTQFQNKVPLDSSCFAASSDRSH